MLSSSLLKIVEYIKNISAGKTLNFKGLEAKKKDELGVLESDLGAAFFKMAKNLKEIIGNAKDLIVNLTSSTKEIETAAQEQAIGAQEHASSITEISATLQELTLTVGMVYILHAAGVNGRSRNIL